ncbi:phosphoribosyl-AMP cyclohydrolase [Pseudoalteromonas umbrosa]|uniref:phosphoribosyl-AMP cyclohydrolase n=1 Tax=Pseudoalteromonas umbrosa TaxID=3048489 RepID=UPI0024C237D7|nr:phosphoribosyl-AMP cyclohydrolase [Pseudoalteromonas sp. B95]MDK1287922.1 phosphoribosyl-AMP cyclohydrolase [Pseudoalteromonas sp. B95]
MIKLATLSLAIASLVSLSAQAAPITTVEVEAAQKGWGEGIVKIGQAKNPKKAAVKHLEQFYAFNDGQVLFKPTLASVDQFRGTQKEALSYFVGQDLAEDKGFALAPYVKVRWENEGIITDGDSAMSMGNYYFTKKNGEEIKVEYSFGYIKDKEGNVKINLHHSSLPFKL